MNYTCELLTTFTYNFRIKNIVMDHLMGIFSGISKPSQLVEFTNISNISLNETELELRKELSSKVVEFEFFKSQIKSYFQVVDDIGTIVKAPIDQIQKSLSASLLPKFEQKYLSFMAYAKLQKARTKGVSRESTGFALDVLLYIIQGESDLDCFELLLKMHKNNHWPSNFGGNGKLISLSLSSPRIEHIVNDGIIVEGGDIQEQMKKMKKMKNVISQISALFEIAGRMHKL